MQPSGDTDCDLSCFSWCVGLVFNVHACCDTVAFLVSGGELACFFMCALVVTQAVVCLVSEGELAWFSMCLVLVTETVASLVSGCELA